MKRLAYSVKEVSELTGLSKRTVSRQIQRGTLRAIRVSRRVVIPADALTEFLGCHNVRGATTEQAVEEAINAAAGPT